MRAARVAAEQWGNITTAQLRAIGFSKIEDPRDDGAWPDDFDADMRFMEGTFVDTAKRLRHGAFAFV